MEGFKLFIIQILIAVIAMIVSGLFTALIAVLLKSTSGWRVDPKQEFTGIDIATHGESAYDRSI